MKKLLGLLVMSGAVTVALFLLTSLSGPGGGQPGQAIMLKPGSQIEEGSIVSIEYTLTDDSGKVIDSSAGKDPLTYIHGAGQIVKGLERELNTLGNRAWTAATVPSLEPLSQTSTRMPGSTCGIRLSSARSVVSRWFNVSITTATVVRSGAVGPAAAGSVITLSQQHTELVHGSGRGGQRR